jgi:ribonuclease HII
MARTRPYNSFGYRHFNRTERAPTIHTNMPVKTKSAKGRPILGRLLRFDQDIRDTHGRLIVIGADEVGRGCLAGPVVAAAAVLPDIKSRTKLAGRLAELNDSKKLSPEQRDKLSLVIRQHAHFAIASASVEEIDQLNILQASLLAKKRAVLDLLSKISSTAERTIILVDGNKKIPELNYHQVTVIQGDGLSASIAAASVIAKVFRDQWMNELAQAHPQYHWHKNKGYGSATHRRAIVEQGLSVWHRQAFIRNINVP